MSSVKRALPKVALFCLLGLAMILPEDEGSMPETAGDTADLIRSEAVIAAKIARKQAKIDEGRKKPQHPDGYARFRSMLRSHPEGTNVTQLLMEAKRQVETMPGLPGERDAGLWNWEWLGPGNIGGRVRAVMTHPSNPDILWAGSAGGGIWKTTNGGGSWYPLHDLLPSLAISSLAMDPTNSNVIYAGSGEGFGNSDALPGAGVFKSYDGGGVWHQLSATVHDDARYINDIAHHPVNSGWLIACGGSSGGSGKVWRTVDGGSTWTHGYTMTDPLTDVKYDPDDPDVVFIGTKNSAYRSDDAGVSWSLISQGGSTLPSQPGRVEFACHEGSDVVYASCDVPIGGGSDDNHAEIWRSEDNGLTWSLRHDSVNYLGQQGWYNNVIWVEPQFPNSIIVGGIDLWKSIDGGTTLDVMSNWRLYHVGSSAHADHHAITPNINYDPEGDRTIYVGNDGGVQAATEGFLTQPLLWWTNLANNLGITQFYGADATPDGRVILGGSQDNDDLRFTRDGGGAQGWYQAETGDGTYAAIDPNDTSRFYTSYVYLQMQRSTNGGATYESCYGGVAGFGVLEDAGDDERALFIAPFALDKSEPGSWLVAGGQSIWRSTTYGLEWVSVLGPRSGDPLCSAVEFGPNQGWAKLWVGYTDGQIWKQEDSVNNWSQVEGAGGALPDRHITDIEISPHDPNTVIVTFSGYYSNRIWLTRNNGASWTLIEGSGNTALPAVQKNCVTFHPNNPDWIYVGTDIGLFASEDLGQNWGVTGRYGSNEGPVYTEIADLIWHSGNTLVAVTHGRGMYECKPLEIVWVDESNSGEEDGTQANPWNTFWEGNGNVGPGATLIVRPGDYHEGAELIEKRIVIEGDGGAAVIR